MDDRPPSGSRSSAAGAAAYGAKQNVQSSHGEVYLTGSVAKTFVDPNDDVSFSPPAGTLYSSRKAHGDLKDTVVETDGVDVGRPSNSTTATAGTMVSSDRHYVEPGLSMEVFPITSGGNRMGLTGSGLVGDRVSIPSDGTLEVLTCNSLLLALSSKYFNVIFLAEALRMHLLYTFYM